MKAKPTDLFPNLKVGDKVIRRWGFHYDSTETAVATVTRISGYRIYVLYISPQSILRRSHPNGLPEGFSRYTGDVLGGGSFILLRYETATPEQILEVERERELDEERRKPNG